MKLNVYISNPVNKDYQSLYVSVPAKNVVYSAFDLEQWLKDKFSPGIAGAYIANATRK